MRMSGWTAANAVVAAALGVMFALRVPLGLPYDEPAHWENVLFYATEHRLPVLGEPGASYEAQMGPVYYVLAAFVVNLTPSPDRTTQATVLRLVGVALLPVLVVLTHRLGRLLSPRPIVAILAATLVATMPLLAAIGGSIQNDYLTFVLIAVVVVLGVTLLRRADAPASTHLLLGVLIGVAVLTKIVALALVPALLLAYIAHPAPSRRLVSWGLAAATGLVASCGWWFVRNVLVYGDLTGAKGLPRIGVAFPPLRIDSAAEMSTLVGGIVSYVYIPVEYYRNALSSPVILRVGALALAALTLAAAGVYIAARWSRLAEVRTDPGLVFALASLLFAVVGWLAYGVAFWYAPFRLVFQAAPVAMVLFAVMTRGHWRGALSGATLVAFVAADLWLALSASGVGDLPFLIR
jgi:hypothetical protein